MICMIMGLQDFNSPVGNGSSAHCLFGEAAVMHWISCSAAGCIMSTGALTRGLGWEGGGLLHLNCHQSQWMP